VVPRQREEIEEHRAELEAARAAEKLARDQALAARKAEIERRARTPAPRLGVGARARRRPRADPDGAPGRSAESPRYDADTVDVLTVSIVEDERIAYVAQQKAREDALKRAARRNVDVGALEAAFNANLLTLAGARRQAARRSASPTRTPSCSRARRPRGKRTDEAARQLGTRPREAAKSRTSTSGASSSSYAAAPDDGQYDAQLAELGFDDAARADMATCCSSTLRRPRRATSERRPRRCATSKGCRSSRCAAPCCSGSARRRFPDRWLVENKFTTDAQHVLLDELRADVAGAEAARARRQAADTGPRASQVSLSTVRRAAQLGIVRRRRIRNAWCARATPTTTSRSSSICSCSRWRTRRRRARKQATPAAAAAAPGLSLAQLATAVKLGVLTLDDYRARAVTLGYEADDVDVLVDVLRGARIAPAARRAHDAIAFELAQRGIR
jgi:hypothetical protein